MRILITCDHYAVASGRYCYNALKRMGHDVRSQGLYHENRIWGIEADEKYNWVPDVPDGDWSPELVIHMDPNRPPLRVDDAPLVVYGVDNHVRTYFPDHDVDHLFLVHGHGHRIGEENVTWLPCGYDPQWFVPGPPLSERRIDAAMVGVDYPQRAQLRYTLLSWMPRMTITYGLALYEQYVAAYHNARISLVENLDNDVAIRVWETAMLGCVLIMKQAADTENLGLVSGENCLIYNTPEECVQHVKWVLANNDAAQTLANNGQAWAHPNTWDNRLQVILDWFGNREAQPAAKPKRKAKVESAKE